MGVSHLHDDMFGDVINVQLGIIQLQGVPEIAPESLQVALASLHQRDLLVPAALGLLIHAEVVQAVPVDEIGQVDRRCVRRYGEGGIRRRGGRRCRRVVDHDALALWYLCFFF